jgi:hypothetical protein
MRCVPHDEDTGGFFVATLRKIPKPEAVSFSIPLLLLLLFVLPVLLHPPRLILLIFLFFLFFYILFFVTCLASCSALLRIE